ncbi:MAG: ABC transporter permease [Pleomorphochaeta sp.]
MNFNKIFKSFFSSVKTFIKNNSGILIALFIMCVIISIANPIFLTQRNLMNVLRQISTNFFLATGMTLVMISGGIDLTVGSVIAVVGVVSGYLSQTGMPLFFVLLLSLALGVAFGAINGGIISRTALAPFIVTLAMMSVLRGAAYIITGGTTVRIDNQSFINFGIGYFLGIPFPVLYMIIIMIVTYIILNRTALGRHIYAVGGNSTAAVFSGIKMARVKMFVYLFSGFMAALSGITLAARSYSGNPIFGNGAEMDAIAACALGGVSLAGGVGSVGGMVIGTLIIGVLNNGLNLMGVDSFWQTSLKGLIILAAVYVDYIREAKKTSN